MFLTFRIFVKVCDVDTLVGAHSFSADAVADCVLLTVDLTEGAVQVPLPVDLITVHLQQRKHKLRDETP